MSFDRDTLVFLLLGLVLVMEFAARLVILLFPKRTIVTRPRYIWRWIRPLQVGLLLLVAAGLYDAYRNPATPPGRLELGLQAAGILEPHARDDFSGSPQAVDPGEVAATVSRDGLQARVVEVVDGDSLVLDLSGGGRWEVRLHGVDAPEHDQPHGEAAADALSRKVLLRRVDVDVVDVDSYGRRVVVLSKKSSNINREMVCEGHAWWYVQYASDDAELQACQASAREQGIGLWATESPIPPWEWRQRGPVVP
jgi:endonuclease YncB( thermonuclease family)